ncbi:MAG: CBS domain-containing protein [Thermodesulfobacteriota bacterium]
MRYAKDIMTTDLITATADMPVERLAELFWKHRISGAPVVDDEGRLTGVVTESDLIDQTKKFHIPTAITLLDSVIFLESEKKVEEEIRKMTGATVGDICTKKPVTIGEDTPVDEIATIMAEKKVHTLPVLRDGILVGVVGKSDIIRTMLPGRG